MLPAGSAPMELARLLNHTLVDELLFRLKRRYDAVLVDAPAVTAGSEATFLASKVDGVVFVIRAGCESAAKIRRAKEQLEGVGGSVLGAVVNSPTGAG